MNIEHCIFVQLEGLTIITNNNPGLLAMNMMGNCSMVNVTVNGFILLYNDSMYTADEYSNILEIKNYSCVGEVAIWNKIILFFSLNLDFRVNIIISDTTFSFHKAFKLIGIVNNAHVDYMLHIKRTYFMHNQINYLISDVTQYKESSFGIMRFSDCTFFNNSMFDTNHFIEVKSNVKQWSIDWVNCLFHRNSNLKFFSPNFQFLRMAIKRTNWSIKYQKCFTHINKRITQNIRSLVIVTFCPWTLQQEALFATTTSEYCIITLKVFYTLTRDR